MPDPRKIAKSCNNGESLHAVNKLGFHSLGRQLFISEGPSILTTMNRRKHDMAEPSFKGASGSPEAGNGIQEGPLVFLHDSHIYSWGTS